MRVAVVGLGYVGLVTATCLASLGQEVDGLESDASKLDVLRQGRVPYFEPHLAGELEAQRAAGRLRFTGDPEAALAGVDVVLICVGTPSDPTGHADLRDVLDVTSAIARHVGGTPVIALRSTVPIGTTRIVERRLNDELRGRLGPVPVFANPEFLRTGRAIEDFLRPTRVIIGRTELGEQGRIEQLAALYAPLEAPLVIMDAEGAELVKNASNAYLAMRISFVNELAALCDATGTSIDDVVGGMALDPRIGSQFMRPGIGYGGSCLPKDVRSIIATAADHGVEMRIARAVDEVNREQAVRVIERMSAAMDGPLDRSRVAVLGLAFKPDTDDTRESPALVLARELRARGAAVVGCDPEASPRVALAEPWLELADDAVAAATGADVVVLATEWPAFVTADLDRLAAGMRGRLIVDARNALDAAKVTAAGLRYVGVGRGVRPAQEVSAAHGQARAPLREARS